MAKITPVTNGLQGVTARTQINTAIESVEIDSTLSGDGNVGTPLSVVDVPWGTMSGTVADQADLQAVLDGKGVKITNRVVVNELAHFPTPVANVITLAASTEYFIGADVDIGINRFLLSPNVVLTSAAGTAILASSTTSDLFTGGDLGLFIMQGVLLDTPTGKVYNIVDTVQGSTTVILSLSRVINCAALGRMEDVFAVNLSGTATLNAPQGLVLAGAINVISLRQFAVISASATHKSIDLGACVCPTIEITDLLSIAPAGAFGISGLANSGNVTAGSIARVTSSEFVGGVTPLENITRSDVRWDFQGNSGIDSSVKNADTYLTASRTVTIGGGNQGVFITVDGVNWASDNLQRYTSDNLGVVTYTSEEGGCFLVIATATIEKDGGGANQLAARIAHNGVPLVKSQSVTENSTPTTVTCIALIDMALGDTLDLQVANLEGTSDIIVAAANMSTISG